MRLTFLKVTKFLSEINGYFNIYRPTQCLHRWPRHRGRVWIWIKISPVAANFHVNCVLLLPEILSSILHTTLDKQNLYYALYPLTICCRIIRWVLVGICFWIFIIPGLIYIILYQYVNSNQLHNYVVNIAFFVDFTALLIFLLFFDELLIVTFSPMKL